MKRPGISASAGHSDDPKDRRVPGTCAYERCVRSGDVIDLWRIEMLRGKNLTIALLLVLLSGMLAPGPVRTQPCSLIPPTTNLEPSTSKLQPVRVLSSTPQGSLSRWPCPGSELAAGADHRRRPDRTCRSRCPAGHSSPGRRTRLPFWTETIAAPPGVDVTVRVTPGKAHTVTPACPTPPRANPSGRMGAAGRERRAGPA